MPVFLKNNSLRPIGVGENVTMILPGQVSGELPDDVLEHSGVKALMATKELEEADDPNSPPPPRRAATPTPPPPPPKEK